MEHLSQGSTYLKSLDTINDELTKLMEAVRSLIEPDGEEGEQERSSQSIQTVRDYDLRN
jgi:hypothetical protein